MSIAYDTYLRNHIQNVEIGCDWILNHIERDKIDDIFPDLRTDVLRVAIKCHDQSKYSTEEYRPYDNYFYRGGHRTTEGKEDFDRAWLHHQHHNAHHWQHWVLLEDDGSGNPKPLDMPDVYIFEMICDWWSFSWDKYIKAMVNQESDAFNNIYEVFDWFEEHKNKIFLTDSTRTKVVKLLDLIHKELDKADRDVFLPMQNLIRFGGSGIYGS